MRRLLAALTFSLLVVTGSLWAATRSWDAIGWYEGASGYAQAVSESEASGKPIFVYFYTEWCPYCRELNRGLLGDPIVHEQVDQMLAVRVNAEAGPGERSLAAHYRVRGYPALFVYTSARGGSFAPVRRTVGGRSGPPRMKTPEEFVEALRSAGG